MKIGVVGLGAAGLRTAMLLEAQGHAVHGFEARDRLGGRMHTIRQPRGWYEAGAEWIGTHDRRIHALLAEFGQVAEPGPKGEARWHFQGRTWSKEELLNHIHTEHELFLLRADELCLDLDEPPWHNVLHAELDSQTLADFLIRTVADPLARAVIEANYRSNEGEDAARVGLLGWLSGMLQTLDVPSAPESPMRFPEGAQKLCEKMAERIRGPLELGMPLRRIEQLGDSVHLYFDDHHDAFDRVVLAIPPPCLRAILFDPELPEAHQEALDAHVMSRTMKVALRYGRKFWIAAGWSGALLSDTAAQEAWDGSRGDDPILLAYLNGDCADSVRASLDPGETLAEAVAEIAPEARHERVEALIHDWTAEPFTQGGFTVLPPEYVLAHWETWMNPAGRICFAGEHASRSYGFVEGALESAERVAEQIGQG